jgi:endonuclease G, mitochondrial
MLNLSNTDRKQLREAIEAAYPSPADLARFVDESLNQNLALISSAPAHRAVIFDLIGWAIAKGYIDDLILTLAQDTQNPQIQGFCRRVLADRLLINQAGAKSLALPLAADLADWDLAVQAEELQSFLRPQSSFEADVGTLQRGLAMANAVCKITFSDRPDEASGTGVLIAPDLVLTNYHVLSRLAAADLNAIAATMGFEFGYVSAKFDHSPRSRILKAVADQPVLQASPIAELDYALIRLEMGQGSAIAPVPLNPTALLQPHDALHLLQHPEGEQMKASLSHNGIVKTNPERGLILYVNPAKSGSSGSPCFDQDWQLVALHHKELATSFGSVREGILLSAIHAQISSFL